MKTAGIICEYNPFHFGHTKQIKSTRETLGEDSGVICVMSGNFVQRGDFAVFNKHARAEAAIRCGGDLVIELPSPYALLSAEGFAAAGVHILDSIGICDYIAFGSESGDIGALREAAEAIVTDEADTLIREWSGKGLSYALARQKAADALLGERSPIFSSPNNVLGIEYLKAISASGSSLIPMTVKRTGAAHDSESGCSASAIRKLLLGGRGRQVTQEDAPRGVPGKQRGDAPLRSDPLWEFMPYNATVVYMNEISAGRGPVSMKACELAMMSRLRAIKDFAKIPGASEGLDHRFLRYAAAEPTVGAILEKVKTKRYAMSRLRRMLMCACLGIDAEDTVEPPPYIRVLAMNNVGMKLLRAARKKTQAPIITKPAAVKELSPRAAELFNKEAAATDFYTLAYPDASKRAGGQEWRTSPIVIEN